MVKQFQRQLVSRVALFLAGIAPCALGGLQARDVIFTLEKGIGRRGETVGLEMAIESQVPIEGFGFAVIYPGRDLELVSITPLAGERTPPVAS